MNKIFYGSKRRNFIFLGALFVLFCGAVLTSCSDISAFPDYSGFSSNEKKDPYSDNIHFYTDPDTGVQYIIYREKVAYAGMGGITPRLNADGTLYTVKGLDKNE